MPVIDRQLERDNLRAVDDVLMRKPDGCVMLEGGPAEGNVAIFAIGMGDGVYATWTGRSADGAIAQVVADLQFVELDQ